MGQQQSNEGLKAVTRRAESRVGKITVSGRYHRPPRKIDDDYKLEKKVLGSGYNGEVHVATRITDGQVFAVKGFKLHGVSKEKKVELESEAEIFLEMDHPHVCRLVDVYESADQLFLVMECMTGGELFDRVKEKKRFTEQDAAEAVWQMLLAINYIHSHGIVHRDIKLENFLYETKNADHLKLIDFGFSRCWDTNTKMAVSCGTLAYVAPEVLGKSYTSKCDLWSLGVVVFILLFGYMPFSGSEQQQVRNIKAGKYTEKKDVMDKVSQQALTFVKALLKTDPEKRLSAEQALDHPWLTQRELMKRKSSTLDTEIVGSILEFAKASAFRRACLGMMAWSLTVEERAKVRDAFMEMDIYHTGTITLAEFKEVLESKFHITDDKAIEAFKALDTNHTDEIHYSEFLAAMVSSRIQLHEDLLKQTFKRFDTDNSGFITVENLKQVLGETFEGFNMKEFIEEADVSADGMISYEEWIEYLRGDNATDNHKKIADKVIDNGIKKGDKQIDRKIAPKPSEVEETSEAKRTSSKIKCCTVQ